ncbi:MAG TPA: hypothetical protein VLL52_10460 [Anaerolineae bacterium]|nr:hypothetical protein [Anaerolineae bacterium]
MKISRRDFLKVTGLLTTTNLLAYSYGLWRSPPPSPLGPTTPYLNGPLSWPIFRPPYFQENANIAALLFPANKTKLTTLCDQYLNPNPNPLYHYQPLSGHILLTCADMWISSLHPQDQAKGRLREAEVGFWLLTMVSKRVNGRYLPHHLAWFLPYLLVDNEAAIATGRELYGFNKLHARIATSDHIWQPHWQVDVMGIDQFKPTAIAQQYPLLTLDCPACPPTPTTPTQWTNWGTAQQALTQHLLTTTPPSSDNQDSLALLTQLLNNQTPLLFRKQIRHPTNSDQAAYQALIEAPLTVNNFHAGGDLPANYQLNLQALDSHPIATTLGLASTTPNKPIFAVWLQLDFTLGHGQEINRSTP